MVFGHGFDSRLVHCYAQTYRPPMTHFLESALWMGVMQTVTIQKKEGREYAFKKNTGGIGRQFRDPR